MKTKSKFVLEAPYSPSGDQEKAISQLLNNLKETKHQVLLGATGTGKTFTIANVIEKTQRRTLVLATNLYPSILEPMTIEFLLSL